MSNRIQSKQNPPWPLQSWHFKDSRPHKMAPCHLAVSPSINFTFFGDPAAEGNFANIIWRPELPSRRELLLYPRDLNQVLCRIDWRRSSMEHYTRCWASDLLLHLVMISRLNQRGGDERQKQRKRGGKVVFHIRLKVTSILDLPNSFIIRSITNIQPPFAQTSLDPG
jgi:hypothetical protein